MERGLLKFITCGSVDDGKSTLIGHMLYDAKLIFADQERALELDSKVGSRGGEIDYSLLLDGLMEEREQGITIDVAYRYFTTEKRSFIVADTPGHEEYTRNMAVGASFADLAVILVDASRGLLTQTKRHARICSLMGIKYFVFAVNKMDIVEYDSDRFEEIERNIKVLAAQLDLENVVVIPVSATEGDNITKRSLKMSWYKGEILLDYLETVDIKTNLSDGFILPVQRVSRPNHEFRGFQGQVESGEVGTGDVLTVLPSGESAKITSILNGNIEVDYCEKGQPVTITLDREIDISRGCVLIKDASVLIGNLFEANLLWMDDKALVEGKNFHLKLGTKLVPATVLNIKFRIDVNTGEHVPTDTVAKNELIKCDILLSEKCVFSEFKANASLGEFVLIDRVTNMTSACGTVRKQLKRIDNLTWHEMDITREYRSKRMEQKPVTLWFTGLSGAGKSTIANALEKRLNDMGKYTMLLDGDNVRMGLNSNLGFKEQDRIENIRRVAEVSKLMNDAGLICLTSFISPFSSDREKARDIIGKDDFIEIYVNTSLEECKRRDVKGLYKKAISGEIQNFTGISSPYEVPENPDIIVFTEGNEVEKNVNDIIEQIVERI